MTESDNLSRFVAYLPFPHSLSGQYYISCPADSREETVSSNLTHTQLNPLQLKNFYTESHLQHHAGHNVSEESEKL